jgi:hypothetical protein
MTGVQTGSRRPFSSVVDSGIERPESEQTEVGAKALRPLKSLEERAVTV